MIQQTHEELLQNIKKYKSCIDSDGTHEVLDFNVVGHAAHPSITHWKGQRDGYLIHFVIKGKGTFNGHKLQKGEGFICTPFVPQCYFPDMSDPWEYIWFHSVNPKAGELFRFLQQDTNSSVFKFRDVSVLENLAQTIQLRNGACVSSAQMLEYFLHVFNAQFTPSQPTQKSVTETYFNYAVEYIFAHLSSKVTVGDLTKVLGITQPYLYKIFQQKTSKSPKQYIDSCKISHAKNLLKETNLTVSKIAEEVGYDNPLVFSKFFSAKENCSPSEYRKRAENT